MLNFSTPLADVDDMIFKRNIFNKIPKIKRNEKELKNKDVVKHESNYSVMDPEAFKMPS